MGWVRKIAYTVPDPATGGRVKRRTKDWYIGWTGADGTRHRKRIGRDKRAAEAALAAEQDRVARARAGVADPAAGDAARPLAALAAEYHAALEARGRDDEYRRAVRRHLAAALPACGWHLWPDVRPHALEVYLGGLRAGGRSPATVNGHLRTVRGFVGWVADRLGAADPLRKVRPLNAEVDRRRSRVLLTDAEFGALLKAAEAAPRRARALVTGPGRAVLYRVAAYSGLRASELASLTPGHFDLLGPTPTVTAEAADSKGKRREPVALPKFLVPVLAAFFAGRPADGLLWPGTWARHKRQRHWLARDLRRAGVGTPGKRADVQLGPDGRPYTFHSLRRKFVTGMIRSGTDIATVRRQARHRNVSTTLNYYAETDLPDQGAAADRLAPPPG
jgi:integrase